MKNKNSLFVLLSALLVLGSLLAAHAESTGLKLPQIIDNNMVLQRGQKVPVWGWATPGTKVTVEFAGQTKSTITDPTGRWELRLGKLKASAEPATMVIKAGETITLTNILVGEVWLASGQSNMEKPIGTQPGQLPCFNSEKELADGDYPNIRLFKVEQGTQSPDPVTEFKKFHTWRACNSNSLDGIKFSAAAYFFGRDIHTNLNIPVGLILSSWGGTRIEPWTPPVGFKMIPWLAEFASSTPDKNIQAVHPSQIFNQMINPLKGYGIRGAIWYQGESNLTGKNDETYADKMNALINGWRQVWGEGNFAFYFVQIAPYLYYERNKSHGFPSPEALPEFWRIQASVPEHVKNSGMVPSTDLVDDLGDIHPRNKLDIGKRLAAMALNKTYGKSSVVCAGPKFRTAKASGATMVVKFDSVQDGLISRDGKALDWFTIAGADGKFVSAKAEIQGSDKVVVSSPEVPNPVSVRFGWNEQARPNLCNKALWPAMPFRSDNPGGTH